MSSEKWLREGVCQGIWKRSRPDGLVSLVKGPPAVVGAPWEVMVRGTEETEARCCGDHVKGAYLPSFSHPVLKLPFRGSLLGNPGKFHWSYVREVTICSWKYSFTGSVIVLSITYCLGRVPTPTIILE